MGMIELKKKMDYINRKVEECLEFESRSDQNEHFRNIKSKYGLQPLRMTMTTAVFRDTERGNVIKRVILKNESQEDVIAMKLNHKNVVATYKTYKYSYRDQKILWLVMEFLNKRLSQSYVSSNISIIKKVLRDSLQGLKYLHDNNIAHLDLKIANIMGEENSRGSIIWKLIDVGYSRDLDLELHEVKRGGYYIKGKSYGTYPYKPPEVFMENIHGKKSDIWNMGAIAWFLARGRTPFYKYNGEKNMEKYKSFIRRPKDYVDDISTGNEDLDDFIEICLQKDFQLRPTVDELLKHSFLTSPN